MLSIDGLYWIFLCSGFLVGFGHCIGMCGPVVVSLSLGLKQKGSLPPHLLYNMGRTLTYTILGGLMGMTGSFTTVAANISSIQKGAMIFSGVLIIVMGFAMTGLISFGKIFGNHYNPDSIFFRGFQRLSKSNSVIAYFPMGLLLGLLPCGPVYTALISAARSGMDAQTQVEGIYTGALIMFCFGIGTIPALLLVGKLTSLKWVKSRDMIYKIGSWLMIFIGVYFVMKGVWY